MADVLTESQLHGLCAYLNATILNKEIKLSCEAQPDYLMWHTTINSAPMAGMPIGTAEFAKSIGGRIPQGLLNRIANDAGLTLAEVKRSRLSISNLISTAAARQRKPIKRTGRPSKKENPAETKIIGAINLLLHERGRDDPPTGNKIAERAGVSPNTVKNFMKKYEQFGSQEVFKGAWFRGAVGSKLAEIQGEHPSKQPEGYDDERPPSKGHRRRGRTPGTSQYDE